MSIQPHTALITGASSGIGEAIAKHLARKGYRVYGTSRKPRPNSDEGIRFLQMNVDEDESVKIAVQELLEKESRLDLVINCAGLGINGSVEEIPVSIVKEAFETNFFGVLRVCQAVIPAMRRQRSGCIINVSSIAGEAGLPFRGFYSASKFALEGMTEAMRMELKPFGIRTCLLQPGDFNTNIAKSRKGIGIPENSPYYQLLVEMKKQIDAGMEHAPGPERVGPFVEKIFQKKNPGLRHKAGAFLEIITPTVKRIVPYKWYESLIMGFYNLKGKTPEDFLNPDKK